ncbi:MAG: hypothetical protein ACR2HX_14690 [Pyrinomonadaceae bacterium]
MRGKSDRFKVEIKDSKQGDARTFIITLTAPAKDFRLTDLFEQRRVIEPLNRRLKQAIKDSLETYLSGAESLVSALASKPKRTLKDGLSDPENGRVRMIRVRSLKFPLT